MNQLISKLMHHNQTMAGSPNIPAQLVQPIAINDARSNPTFGSVAPSQSQDRQDDNVSLNVGR